MTKDIKRQVLDKIMKDGTDGWSDRDALPTGDPIGDVDEIIKEIKSRVKAPKGSLEKRWNESQQTYFEMMRERLLNPEGKKFDCGYTLTKKCCSKPDKYKNIISNSLKFYSCKNCGADLGDIND